MLLPSAQGEPSTQQQITSSATEVGVDDQVQNEVDGKVRQQKEVGDVSCHFDRADIWSAGACRSTCCERHRRRKSEKMRRWDEQSEENNKGYEGRCDAMD